MRGVRTASCLLAMPLLVGNTRAQCTSTDDQRLVPADAAAGDQFGSAAATDGDVVVLGALRDDSAGSDVGAAYVFRHSAGGWSEEQELTPGDGTGGEFFGVSVAVSGDVVVAGAELDNDPGTNSGSAYVFRWNGVGWNEEARLTASDGETEDRFGRAVSVDGDIVVVGAHWDDEQATNSGSAFVYCFDGIGWNETQKLIAKDGINSHGFGFSLTNHGDWIAVGANADNDGGVNAGAVYLFQFDGSKWRERQKLLASDPADDDRFGWSVAMNDELLVVGAPWSDAADAAAGAVYVFRRSGSQWSEEKKLLPPDPAVNRMFGRSVDLDGVQLAIGAQDDHAGVNSGSVYSVRYDGASWVHLQKMVASDGESFDDLGVAVAIAGDELVAGAPSEDSAGSNAGVAYSFTLPDLGFHASNTTPAAGDDVTFTTCGGRHAAAVMVAVVELNGSPWFLPLVIGQFDSEGAHSFGGSTPSGLAGVTASFLALGFLDADRLGVSDPVLLTFQ